jgi:hypothetical protein
MTFRAPVRDLIFTLTDIIGVRQLEGSERFEGFDLDTVSAVLEAAGVMAAEVLAPLDQPGDRAGARYENGRVTAPAGFGEAYTAFSQGGWGGLSADPDFGGQGLPKVLELAVFEMVSAANMAFGLCPMLTAAAIEALHTHGTKRQKSVYLTRLVSGEWTGTMQLTEPQAGSDLSQVRTTAEPDGDGGWLLTGQKIFITWGDHDCADNIIGMVLARTTGAPEGTKGLSLFLVPARLVGEDGRLGAANAVKPVSVEHKLGIHASPTCVMAFEGARGELVGELHQGLANMFVMMNSARIAVGVQGVAIAERAYQQALLYARERRQGRAVWSAERPAAIVDHPDVRRTLGLAKAKIEAARAICLSAGVAGDLARHSPDAEVRRAAKLREELLTPIAKAWSTDVGVEVASAGVQVHGGMGFIEETGAAQHYRDARIPPIYEGTNGIQAIDLVGRKLALGGGEAVRDLIGEMRGEAQSAATEPHLIHASERLEAAVAALDHASETLGRGDVEDGLAGATAYLRLWGDALGGALLIRIARTALGRLGQGDDDTWLQGKAALADLYADQILTGAPALAQAATAGAEQLRRLTPGALGAR